MDPVTEFLVAKEEIYWAATSALAAWILGFSGLFINAVGIYLVWGQLKANREAMASATEGANAATEAAKVAHLAARPWIKFSISKAFLSLSPENLEQIGCQINYRYENIGQTPAVQVSLLYKPVPATPSTRQTLSQEFANLLKSETKQPRALFPGEFVEEGKSQIFPFPRLPDEDWMSFRVVAAIVYKAHATGETYVTPFIVQLQQKEPPEDRVYRVYRGMGHHEFLTIPLHDETPDPT